jgi:cytochrome oxidase Cu insertion factor (SCO1/SenC/PrrC family)
MSEESSKAPSPTPPQRFGAPAWVAVFIAVAVLAFLAWSQFQRAKLVSSELLPDLGSVPMFRFTNEQNETVTRSDWDGQITVVNFVFTRCTGPCPLMTSRMVELQQALARRDVKNVRLVTVSVDPEFDTPEVLKTYAQSVRADPDRWSFFTGPRPAMEDFVVRGMLQPLAEEPDGMPAHSTRFIVVDPNGKIRAFRDGENPEAVGGLLLDIGSLLREFNLP